MADKPNIHSKLITEEARKTLGPLGLVQKGRSRVWLDDQVWWAGVVEFQPSVFSKGSHLNVGCMWLWHVKAHIGYAVVNEVGQFHSFESEEQFRPAANLLARQAAQEILRVRSLFSSAADVRLYYTRKSEGVSLWRWFDGAIASALSGKPEEARRLFDKVVRSNDNEYDWVKEARSDARHLSALTFQPEEFREAIVHRVQKTRELQKLRSVSQIGF